MSGKEIFHFLPETPIDHRDNNVEKIERRRSHLDFVVQPCLELQDPTGGRIWIVQIHFRVRTMRRRKQPAIRSTFASSVRLFDFSHDHDRTIRPLVFNDLFYYHYISLFYQFLHDRREGFAKDLKVRVSICFLLFFLSLLSVRFRVRRRERSVSREIEWIENSSQEIRAVWRFVRPHRVLPVIGRFRRVPMNVTGCNSWKMVDKSYVR